MNRESRANRVCGIDFLAIAAVDRQLVERIAVGVSRCVEVACRVLDPGLGGDLPVLRLNLKRSILNV